MWNNLDHHYMQLSPNISGQLDNGFYCPIQCCVFGEEIFSVGLYD